MTDVLTPDQRRAVMARIRGKDTIPELLVRRGLHALGLRYRLYGRGLPGRPDMVFRRHRAVVFTHGCFWHRHGCTLFRWPKTRAGFWADKLRRNRERDQETLVAVSAAGWRVLVIWECALKGRHRKDIAKVLTAARDFVIKGEVPSGEIAGTPGNGVSVAELRLAPVSHR